MPKSNGIPNRLVIKTDNLAEFYRVCQEKGVSMTAMVKILIADFLKRERE